MNMRKIIAMLAVVLMLCAAIPVAAFGTDFEDGTANGWQSDCGVAVENIDGSNVLVWNANLDWANMYNYCNLSANTEYVMTMKVKADRDTDMNFKVLSGDWGSVPFQTTFGVSTEWQEISVQFNSGDNGSFVMLSTNTTADNGATYYVDDFSIEVYVAPAVPGQIVNGDFETGEANGWNLPQVGGVKAEAAHSGSYGINIKGNGGWGGMLDQTIPVEAGKTYEVSLWVKVIATGVNIQVKDGDTSGANLDSTWEDINKAGDWKQIVFTVSPTQNTLAINFCGGGTGVAEDVYVDDVVVKELKTASFDGYIYNGDFEIGDAHPWTTYSGTAVDAAAAKNGEYGLYIKNPTGGWGGTAFQDFSVEIGKSYEVTMWAKALSQGQNIQIQNGGANVAGSWFNKTEWTLLTYEFTATATNVRINICGGGTYANEEIYVDDIKVVELKQASYDGYIYNGDFETAELFPWDNLWGSCPTVEIVEGMDGGYGLHIVSGQWKHVRQTNIAVEANTDYKITAWVKNAANMSLLVKDGGDSKDIVNAGVSAGEEWTEFTKVFNTGDYTTIIFSLMGNQEEAYGIFDNIKIEKIGEHNYEITDGVWPTCTEDGYYVYTCACGASYEETAPAYHNGGMEYNPAKEAIDCANPGNIENYFCPGCGEYFADANATEIINPWYIQITVDCVKPEGLADCAGWTCETCGNENFGSGEHDVVVCQGGICSKCNAEIEGTGCQNYDTPACQDGVCYYCGGFVAGFGHENGAWAPCLDGECSYGCGLTYPATEDHVDADADDYCDNCWNHLAHIDEDNNGECDVCWSPMPAADIVYGDANGDGEINILDEAVLAQYNAGWDVTLDEAAADANGDGEINILDEALLAQYNAGWDVVLGG